MEAAFAAFMFVYTRRKKLELTFSHFLANKKLELDSPNFFNHSKKKTTLNRLLKPGKEKGAYGAYASHASLD